MRRRKGDGSIYRRSDGRWVGQITIGRYPNGRPRYARIVRSTEAEVEDDFGQLTRRAVSQLTSDATRNMDAYLHWWLDNVLPGTVSEETEDDYRDKVDRYLVPHLGKTRLDKLNKMHVQTTMRRLELDGYSPDTRRLARTVLKAALDWAVPDLIRENPVKYTRGPRGVVHRTDDALSPEEASAVLDAANGDRLYALALLVLRLGLRQGEALALFWPDATPGPLLSEPRKPISVVDLDAGTVTVQTTLKKRRAARGGGLYVKPKPKSEASEGTIPLVAGTGEALRAHRTRQAAERLKAGGLWCDYGLVFCSQRGKPLHATNVWEWWQKVCERAGVGRRRFHATRHTCAVHLLDAGVPLELVSAILRHAKLGTTADIYARVTQDGKRRGLIKLNEFLTGG